jgi:solute carrier family 35 (GDP-fucose transporter), member C1
MVIANKWLLNEAPDLPLLLLWLQLVVAVILILVCHGSGLIRFSNENVDEIRPLNYSPNFIVRFLQRIWHRYIPTTDLETAKKLTPLIAVNVVGLSLNTLCLKTIDASLYQVPRVY